MVKTICIFEDAGYSKLLPLVYTRAVYELKCGINSLLDKITADYPETKVVLFTRDYLTEVAKERYNCPVNEVITDDCLFINGRVIFDEKLPLDGKEEICTKDNTIIYMRLNKEKSSIITPKKLLSIEASQELSKQLPQVSVIPKSYIITYFWDLVSNNANQIKTDFKKLAIPKIEGQVYPGAHILNQEQVYIGSGTKIKPGVVIDAEDGPVYIDTDVLVEPNAIIQGPSFIGRKSIIRPGAKIREGTSIGEVSRVGGEVEGSIIHSYSNKQHDGFLGHAYIGMWCNLGAGTNNSDLKNNYSTVKVYVEGKLIDSGSLFVGLMMCDHSKSGIGTTFNTGSVVGVSCNIFGTGYPPKYVPSFSWGGGNEFTTYKLDEAIKTAKTVMSRRKIQMSNAEEKLLCKIFELTSQEHKNL